MREPFGPCGSGESLAEVATSIIFVFVATNACFVVTQICLSRQNLFWSRPKICLLSRQKYVCREKTFVATKLCLSR